MPGWDGFPVREALSQELGCPVMVDNDVNLMALGEQHAGVARTVHDFLVVKIGTGIGCGIVVGGDVYRGTTGSAGDIGHIQAVPEGRPCACGNRGCLEAHFSGAALARDATEAAQQGLSAELASRLEANGGLSAADVAAAAAAGDATALGQVIAGLVSFFNPGLVVIGGGVTGLGHNLLAAIRTQVYRQSLPLATGNLPIVLGELGPTAGVIGAARLISDHLFSPA
jgi:predicted NBD/HSP70 family sugar kinase